MPSSGCIKKPMILLEKQPLHKMLLANSLLDGIVELKEQIESKQSVFRKKGIETFLMKMLSF